MVAPPNIGALMAFRLSSKELGWLAAEVGREAAESPNKEEAGARPAGAAAAGVRPRAEDMSGAAEGRVKVGAEVVMELSEGAETAGVFSLVVVAAAAAAASTAAAAAVVVVGGWNREVEGAVVAGAGSGAGFSGSLSKIQR